MPQSAVEREAEKQKRAREKAAAISRYGEETYGKLRQFYRSITYRQCWGLMLEDEETGSIRPIHANRTDDINFNKEWMKQRKAGASVSKYPHFLDLLRWYLFDRHISHLDTGDKTDLLFFQSRPRRSDDGDVDVFVMLDIDLHDSDPDQMESDAMALAHRLVSSCGLSAYLEPSTNGRGCHCYCWFQFPRYSSNERIRDSLNQLSRLWKDQTSSWGFRSEFDAIKASPPVFEKNGVLVSPGVLGKLPLPRTKADADALLSLRRNDIEPLLENDREGGGGEGHNSMLLLPHKQQGQSVPAEASEDTFERARRFICMERPRHPLWSKEQLWNEYVKKRLDFGNSDQRCFDQAWKFSERTWNPQKAKSRSLHAQAQDAKSVIMDMIRSNGRRACLDADQQMRDRRRRSRLEKTPPKRLSMLTLCRMYALISNSLRWNRGTGTIGYKQIDQGLRIIFNESLDGARYKAAMRWFRRNGLLKVVSRPIYPINGQGRCRVYRLGPRHPDAAST